MKRRLLASERGATLLEFTLLLPLLVLLLVGIIVFGMDIFYQQQINNAAREAARYASTHSATSQCPTVSWLDPAAPADLLPAAHLEFYSRCDAPETGWAGNGSDAAGLTKAAQNATIAMPRAQIKVSACWSGFWLVDGGGSKVGGLTYDAQPPTLSPPESAYFTCTVGGKDPRKASGTLACPEPSLVADDQGSNVPGNSVTVYACYVWTPPMAGFLLLPSQITFRAVATEIVHRQR